MMQQWSSAQPESPKTSPKVFYKSSSKTKTFLQFMEREPSLTSESDKKVLNLIRHFQKSLSPDASPRLATQASFNHPQASSQTSFSDPETLRVLQKTAAALDKLQHALGASGQEGYCRAKAMRTFCRLFEVGQAEAETAVESVYFFVAEIKHFLSVSSRQLARQFYRLAPSTSVKTVLARLVQTLDRA